jgi:hypothetical protein
VVARRRFFAPAIPGYHVSGTVEATICQAGDAYNVTIGEHRGASVARQEAVVTDRDLQKDFSAVHATP